MSAAEEMVPTQACKYCKREVEDTFAAWYRHFDNGCAPFHVALRAEALAESGPAYVPEHEEPRHHRKSAFVESQVTALLDRHGML